MCLPDLDQNASLCSEAGHRLDEALLQGRLPPSVPYQDGERHPQSVQEGGLITTALMGPEGERTLGSSDDVGRLDGL